jgi:hypothetical protein
LHGRTLAPVFGGVAGGIRKHTKTPENDHLRCERKRKKRQNKFVDRFFLHRALFKRDHLSAVTLAPRFWKTCLREFPTPKWLQTIAKDCKRLQLLLPQIVDAFRMRGL